MFDHTHYVPVLRWRMAEWCALRDLDLDVKKRMTPLIELLPKDFEVKEGSRKRASISEILDNKIQELLEYWGEKPFFLDFQYIENKKANGNVPIQEAFAIKSASTGLLPIPVLGLGKHQNDYQIIKNDAKTLKTGVCIRIYPHDLNDATFPKKLEDALSFFECSPDKIDIVFDNLSIVRGV